MPLWLLCWRIFNSAAKLWLKETCVGQWWGAGKRGVDFLKWIYIDLCRFGVEKWFQSVSGDAFYGWAGLEKLVMNGGHARVRARRVVLCKWMQAFRFVKVGTVRSQVAHGQGWVWAWALGVWDEEGVTWHLWWTVPRADIAQGVWSVRPNDVNGWVHEIFLPQKIVGIIWYPLSENAVYSSIILMKGMLPLSFVLRSLLVTIVPDY